MWCLLMGQLNAVRQLLGAAHAWSPCIQAPANRSNVAQQTVMVVPAVWLIGLYDVAGLLMEQVNTALLRTPSLCDSASSPAIGCITLANGSCA